MTQDHEDLLAQLERLTQKRALHLRVAQAYLDNVAELDARIETLNQVISEEAPPE